MIQTILLVGSEFHDSMMPHWGGGWWMIFGIIMWVLMIVALVLFIKWLWTRTETHTKKEDESLEILKRRYAKGEISKEEYEEKKSDLL